MAVGKLYVTRYFPASEKARAEAEDELGREQMARAIERKQENNVRLAEVFADASHPSTSSDGSASAMPSSCMRCSICQPSEKPT